MNRTCIILVILGLVTIGICYYLWFSPLFIFIGGVCCITGLLLAVLKFLKKDDDAIGLYGCFMTFVIIGLLVASFFMDRKTYISSFGSVRHLYIDCKYIEGLEIHEVRTVSALLWGCIKECSYCKKTTKERIARKVSGIQETEKETKSNFY